MIWKLGIAALTFGRQISHNSVNKFSKDYILTFAEHEKEVFVL